MDPKRFPACFNSAAALAGRAPEVLVILSILLLTTVELLRRRSERLRGLTPG